MNAQEIETQTSDDILAESIPLESDVKAAEAFLERRTYATVALLAMAEVFSKWSDNDDDEGVRMLRRFARDFASYEARTL